MYALREFWLVGFVLRPSLMKYAEKAALGHLAKQVPDPSLREKLTPHFRLGCKRVLLSNDYYPALVQPNVDVVTDRIVEVTETALVTESSTGARTRHDVDTIIFGTGFRIGDLPMSHQVRGSEGRTLAECWAADGMSALHGMTVAGFPNLFMLVGPNTGLGHNSIVLMIEAQVRYLLDLLDKRDANGAPTIEPRRNAQTSYNDRLQRQMQGTVWTTGGCESWYLDASGRNRTLWPTFTFSFMRELRHANLADYELGTTPSLPREAVSA
jgi:cation diffusion facilitator CzcD-associated flavoprotein CzcO